MSPVVPSTIESLIVRDTDSFCVVFQKLLQTAYQFYKFSKYRWKNDGTIGTDFGKDLCDMDCTQTSTV